MFSNIFKTLTNMTAASDDFSVGGDLTVDSTIELGHASDTTIARASSGDITIEGNAVYRAGGTDIPVADGGTGASSLTDNSVLTGTGTSAITAESNLTFDGTDLGIAATGKIYLDGSGDTYIHEASADDLEISVGGIDMLKLKQDSGKYILFAGANAGHTLQTTSYSYNDDTSSGGTNDTDVDFTNTSKRILTMTGDINQLNVICPKTVSSNLTLKIVHSGGAFDVSTWRVWRDNNGTLADTSANVKWPGGSAPTLSGTDGDVDIITFWWDGTNYLCYGNAALDFS